MKNELECEQEIDVLSDFFYEDEIDLNEFEFINEDSLKVKDIDEVEFIYEPNEKQKLFHKSASTYCIYGGAKGGGKTAALMHDAYLYALENQGADIYLFRETYDQLEANIIRPFKIMLPPIVDEKEVYKYNDQKHSATFYNGSTIFFRYMANMKDAERFQGYSMQYVGVDELTRYTEGMIDILLSCMRSAKGHQVRFRATCNPGKLKTAVLSRDI